MRTTHRTPVPHVLELLESRIAPAAVTGPDLHISLADNIAHSPAGSVAHGGTIVYTITYENAGDADAKNVVIEDTLGAHTSFDFSNQTAMPAWTTDGLGHAVLALGDVPADGPHTVSFTVDVDRSIPTSVKTVGTSMSIHETKTEEQPTAQLAADPSLASLETTLYQGIYVIAPGVAQPGKYAPPTLRVFNIATASEFTITASTRDSLRTAVADFNGDGFDDVLVLGEHGQGGVHIYDGLDGHELMTPLTGLQPFGRGKGGFVAATNSSVEVKSLLPGGVGGTVAFGSSLGGGAVAVYNSLTGQQIGDTFYPFTAKFKGGVRVAVGDLDGDATTDLVVAQGNFGNDVQVFGDANPARLITEFHVGGAHYRGGLNLTVAAATDGAPAKIITGRNRLGSSTIDVFTLDASSNLEQLAEFTAFAPRYHGGVRVAVGDFNEDGTLDIIAAVGYAGKSLVNIFDGTTIGVAPKSSIAGDDTMPTVLKTLTAFPNSAAVGLWVAGSSTIPSIAAIRQPV